MTESVREAIERARTQIAAQNAEWEAMQVSEEEKHVARIEASNKWRAKTIPAKPELYTAWLHSYIKSGGKITNAYGYPSTRWDFIVALGDFDMTPLYGSESVSLIVPKGVEVGATDCGHSNIFFMDGPRTVGCFVPIFTDTIAGLETLSKGEE